MSVSSLLIQLHALADSDQLVIHSWVPSPPLASLALLTHAVAWLLWTQKHQASVGIDIASSLMDTLLYSIQPNFHFFACKCRSAFDPYGGYSSNRSRS